MAGSMTPGHLRFLGRARHACEDPEVAWARRRADAAAGAGPAGIVGWGMRFLANCRTEHWRENSRAILALARFSADRLAGLLASERIALDRNPPGLLKLFRDELSMAGAKRAAGLYGELGLPLERLDAAGCVAAEPALAPIRERIIGGLHYPADGSGDALQFTRSLAARCTELGVGFCLGERVLGLEREGDRSPPRPRRPAG